MVSFSTAIAQTLVWSDDSNDNNPIGWYVLSGYPGVISETNQQFSLTGSFTSPLDPLNIATTHAPAYHSLSIPGALVDQQTLELRVDLVSANQNDAWAGIAISWTPQWNGYAVFMDHDDVYLDKFYSLGHAPLSYEHPSLKSQNATLVLGLTRDGSNLEIRTTVLDKEQRERGSIRSHLWRYAPIRPSAAQRHRQRSARRARLRRHTLAASDQSQQCRAGDAVGGLHQWSLTTGPSHL